MKIPVYVASAFSKNQEGGNKAGVVFTRDSNKLTITQKMAIAKRLGYAETAFISESKTADYKLEFFTPKEEVDLCGHATIGSFTILMHLNKLTSNHHCTIETNSGNLAIIIKDKTIFMEQNKPVFGEFIPKSQFNACFDIDLIDEKYPVQIVSTGLKDILIRVKNETDLHTLQPNFEKIKEVSEHYNVVGTHLYAFHDNRIITRNFAPLYDINEEAATGTSNGALACYLYEHRYLQTDRYVFEQGYSLHSPSEILVELETTNKGEIEKVWVGGKGYYSETKYLDLDNLR